jgi:hypothetical protein
VKIFKQYMMHDKLLIRFGALLVVVLVIFFCAWTLSYLFLPEGILRGRNIAQVLAGSDLAGGSIWLEWLRIFAINLGVMLIVIISPNIFRTEGGFPLGYSTISLLAVIFGVALGTNSFTLSLGGKLLPTMAIFESSGLYEITAYVLAATATTSISKFRLIGKWPKQTIEKIVPLQDNSMIQERNVGIILAITILIIACGWEAYRFSLAIAS